MRLIAVAMGEPTSNTRNSEVSSLLDYGYNMFQSNVYVTKDKVINNVKVDKGVEEYVNIVPMNDVISINKKGTNIGNITYEFNIKNVKAPIKKGEKVGTVTIKEDGNVISTEDVTVEKSINKAGLFTVYIRHLKDILSINLN